jgi:hypothetical protein
MIFFKILLTSCSLLGGNFSGGDVAPNINYSRLDGEEKRIECQKMGNSGNEFVCLGETNLVNKSKKTKEFKAAFGVFKAAAINDNLIILSNDSKSQIFQIVKTQVLYH